MKLLAASSTAWSLAASVLAGIIGLGQFALESIFTDSGAVKLPHDKTVFFNEIAHRLFFVRDSLKPLVLIYVAFNNIFLCVNDVMKVFALVEHGVLHRLKIMCL